MAKPKKAQLEADMRDRLSQGAATSTLPQESDRPGLDKIVREAERLGYRRGAVPLEDGMDVVFVYGTLQPGWPLHGHAFGQEGVVAAYEPQALLLGYRMYAEIYPWITKSSPEEHVWGTLLFLQDAEKAMGIMDGVELGAGYRRIRAEIQTPTGPVGAWAYVWEDMDYVPWFEENLVEDGDFAAFVSRWERDHTRHGPEEEHYED